MSLAAKKIVKCKANLRSKRIEKGIEKGTETQIWQTGGLKDP